MIDNGLVCPACDQPTVDIHISGGHAQFSCYGYIDNMPCRYHRDIALSELPGIKQMYIEAFSGKTDKPFTRGC